MSLNWVRLFLFGCDEMPSVEYQGGLRRDAAAFDFADKNDMIAFGIAAAVVAFEPGRTAFENRKPGVRQLELDAFETIGDAARETFCQSYLFGGQYIDHIVRITGEERHAACALRQTPQHQGRIE